MNLLRLLASRLGQALLLVVAVVVLNFALVHAAPGDPVETIAGASGGMSEELKAELRQSYGLDKPLPVQLGVYLSRVARLDLGYSYFFNLPVVDLIGERVPATLLLVLSSVICAFVAGTGIGVLAARKPNGWLSQTITVLSLVGFAAPVFWTGILLIVLFAVTWKLLPAGGADSAASYVLPSLTLGIFSMAIVSRMTRSTMIERLDEDYVRTVRGKGVREITATRHALRNAAIPIATTVGVGIALLIGGVVVTETVFAIPGIGRLTVDSILRRDYPVIQGIVLVTASAYVAINLVTDLLYGLFDPRIRY